MKSQTDMTRQIVDSNAINNNTSGVAKKSMAQRADFLVKILQLAGAVLDKKVEENPYYCPDMNFRSQFKKSIYNTTEHKKVPLNKYFVSAAIIKNESREEFLLSICNAPASPANSAVCFAAPSEPFDNVGFTQEKYSRFRENIFLPEYNRRKAEANNKKVNGTGNIPANQVHSQLPQNNKRTFVADIVEQRHKRIRSRAHSI